jgi:hypothetical protein
MDDTNPSGSEPLNVNTAASAFLGMMGDEGESDNGQLAAESEDQNEDVAEASDDDSEVEYTEDSDDDVEEADDAEPERKKFKVKAAGEEIEVELDELISGYQRSKDYTQKSQALAEQRKEIEAERAKVAEVQKERETYAQRLQAVDQFLAQQSSNYSEQELSVLKETDPIGYAVKVAERIELDKKRAVISAEQQRLAEKQQAEQSELLQKHLASESELLTQKAPELSGEKGNSIKKEILSFAKELGYSNEELGRLYDHRAVLTLYKAMKYEQLQKSKPDALKKVQSAPKTMKSGSSNPPTKSAQDKKVMQKLRQTGKVRDAATAFERFL